MFPIYGSRNRRFMAEALRAEEIQEGCIRTLADPITELNSLVYHPGGFKKLSAILPLTGAQFDGAAGRAGNCGNMPASVHPA